jgi:mRNA-degrading endonuclease toxin of MazEF toxin-antitoxin module
VRRGEIYRTREETAERGHKPGYYVIVSRDFVAANEDVATVVCAPVYSNILGIRSEVVIGADEGLTRNSAVRCDFLTLMFKSKLTRLAGALSAPKIEELNDALRYALDLG